MGEIMRFYSDALEMIKEVERDLAEMGIIYQSYSVQDQIVTDNPAYRTKELMGYGYKLFTENNVFKNLKEMLKYKKDDNYITWVKAELSERINTHSNPGEAWKIRKDFWEQYLRHGKFSYTYAERWGEQLKYIIQELRERPESRQIVMTMYDRHQDMMNWRSLDRVPCSLTYQFLIRSEELHVIYSMRSCDFSQFFQADVWITIQLLNYISSIIDVKVGSFTHIINSLHVFMKDVEEVF